MPLKHTQSYARDPWLLAAIIGVSIPMLAGAQGADGVLVAQVRATTLLFFVAAMALAGMVIVQLWSSFVHGVLQHGTAMSSRSHQVYQRGITVVFGTTIACAALYLLALKAFHTQVGTNIAAVAWACIAVGFLGILLQLQWPKTGDYCFAALVGTALAFVLITLKRLLFGEMGQDPYFLTLAIVCVLLSWRFLFGPWAPHVKATVLGTFIGWIAFTILLGMNAEQRGAHAIAALVALLPACVWCVLFLKYHRERLSVVLLMFFSGMLATAPILFYDLLVRSGMQMDLFLFKVIPQSFTSSSDAFVSSNLSGFPARTSLMVTFVSFVIVGVIEEFSKFWVLQKSGEAIFTSIDDVLQLAIITAIGFAFAENVLNPTYFVGFVRQYLLVDIPDWKSFAGNVLGRSVLTSMVHIVSTGVLGYFYGVALFAQPYLEEERTKGHRFLIVSAFHRLLRLPEKAVFRRQELLTGVLCAVGLHALFNFLVTLPDILPGNPQSVGDLFTEPYAWLNAIPLLIIPALLYVVGGFWLLTELFLRKVNMEERGQLVRADTFVTADARA